MCEYSVCHADGWSCSVNGSYGVSDRNEEAKSDITKSSRTVAADDDAGQTRLNDWWLLLMVPALFLAALLSAVLTGWRLK